MSKVSKTLKKNKDVEWRYVKGKRTPFRNGKELKIGTRPKELIKAVGGDLSNAFRDVLKIGRVGKNPQFDPETGRALNLLEAQRLNKLNNADIKPALEAGAVEREENEWGPGGQPSASAIADLQLRNKGLAETKKYKKGKVKKERQAGWSEADLQDARDLGAGSSSGMREWTTDQKASDQGSFTAIPPDKGGKGGVSESKASSTSEKWTGEVGSRKLTNPTAIQKKLIKAGHDQENLVKLMINYKKKYKDKRGW